MGILDTIFRCDPPKTDALPVQSAIVTPRRPVVDKIALQATGLRTGMWVAKDGKIGILTGMGIDGIAEITLTKIDGGTQMMLDEHDKPVSVRVMARAEDVRQAFIEEIPETRRPAFDTLLALGYRSNA